MPFIAAYAAVLLILLALDGLWLRTALGPLLRRRVPDLLRERPRMGVALVFYALYAAVVLLMAVVPAVMAANWLVAPFYGVLLGLLAHGTHQARSLAMLRGWGYGILAADMAWGAALTALAATLGYLVVTAGFG